MVWRNGAERCWHCDSLTHDTGDCSQRNQHLKPAAKVEAESDTWGEIYRTEVEGAADHLTKKAHSLVYACASIGGPLKENEWFVLAVRRVREILEAESVPSPSTEEIPSEHMTDDLLIDSLAYHAHHRDKPWEYLRQEIKRRIRKTAQPPSSPEPESRYVSKTNDQFYCCTGPKHARNCPNVVGGFVPKDNVDFDSKPANEPDPPSSPADKGAREWLKLYRGVLYIRMGELGDLVVEACDAFSSSLREEIARLNRDVELMLKDKAIALGLMGDANARAEKAEADIATAKSEERERVLAILKKEREKFEAWMRCKDNSREQDMAYAGTLIALDDLITKL